MRQKHVRERKAEVRPQPQYSDPEYDRAWSITRRPHAVHGRAVGPAKAHSQHLGGTTKRCDSTANGWCEAGRGEGGWCECTWRYFVREVWKARENPPSVCR